MSSTELSSSVELVGVGHETDLLEELVDRLDLTGRADELGQILEPPSASTECSAWSSAT